MQSANVDSLKSHFTLRTLLTLWIRVKSLDNISSSTPLLLYVRATQTALLYDKPFHCSHVIKAKFCSRTSGLQTHPYLCAWLQLWLLLCSAQYSVCNVQYIVYSGMTVHRATVPGLATLPLSLPLSVRLRTQIGVVSTSLFVCEHWCESALSPQERQLCGSIPWTHADPHQGRTQAVCVPPDCIWDGVTAWCGL